jgi:hypothetical protein
VGLFLVLAGLVATFFAGLEDLHWLATGIGSLFVAASFFKAHRLRHHPRPVPKVAVLQPEI